MRSRATFLIAWTPALEKPEEVIEDGRAFRNYLFAYWLDYVHEFGGPDANLIIVQTQCDTRADDAVLNPEVQVKLHRFGRYDNTVFSAKTSRRGDGLLEVIDEACSAINAPKIGVGRARVKAHLESLRDNDARQSNPDQRTHRTMSRADFETLCEKTGGVVDTELLAEFLHDCGTVFYRKGLFRDQLVIDQAWVLESIYAVFHREDCLPVLESEQGRFTRSLIGALLWNQQGLSEDEQSTLIQMMTSCGICFEYQQADRVHNTEARYIAPDLLRNEPPKEVLLGWDDQMQTVRDTFTFPFLTPTLMRSILSAIGSKAKLSAHYWKNGVFFYDTKRNSRAMIVQAWTGEWSGHIRVQCQVGDAQRLQGTLVTLLFEQIDQLGFKPTSAPDRPRKQQPEDIPGPTPIGFGRESADRQWYVSYARVDKDHNSALVDRFCEHTQSLGLQLLRDEEQLVPGDRISRFMNQLAEGERIYVFLSKAYLESIFCMTELHGIWQRCESDEERFRQRVRVYLSDDLSPGDTTHMLAIRQHWQQKLQAFDEIPSSKSTSRMRAATDRIRTFAEDTYDILDVIYDRVQFREEKPLFNDVTQGD